MGYNIDNITIVKGELTMIKSDFLAAFADVGNERPEGSIFNRADVKLVDVGFHEPKYKVVHADDFPDKLFYSENFNKLWWYGSGSGSYYNAFIKKVLPRMKGEADLIISWGHGEDITGLRVKDGKVTEHKVGFVLLDAKE